MTGGAEDRSEPLSGLHVMMLSAFFGAVVTCLIAIGLEGNAKARESHLVTFGDMQACAIGQLTTTLPIVTFTDAETGKRIKTNLPVVVEYNSDECARWRR